MSSPVSREDKKVDLSKEVRSLPIIVWKHRSSRNRALVITRFPFHTASGKEIVLSSRPQLSETGDSYALAHAQTALYPESAAAVSASDVGILAWKGDLLALGVFEEAISPAGKGEGALCFFSFAKLHLFINMSLQRLSR